MKKLLNTFDRFLYLMLIPLGIMWATFIATHYFNISLSHLGILPREISGLKGILLSPFIHKDLGHIINNSYPILVLGFILISSFPKISYEVMLIVYVLTGILVWTFARGNTYHIGASGVVYGMAVFIIASGFLNRDLRSIALAFVVVFFYGGSIIWGVLPLYEGISWESHLMGGLVGGITAYLFRNPVAAAKIEREEQKRFFEEH